MAIDGGQNPPANHSRQERQALDRHNKKSLCPRAWPSLRFSPPSRIRPGLGFLMLLRAIRSSVALFARCSGRASPGLLAPRPHPDRRRLGRAPQGGDWVFPQPRRRQPPTEPSRCFFGTEHRRRRSSDPRPPTPPASPRCAPTAPPPPTRYFRQPRPRLGHSCARSTSPRARSRPPSPARWAWEEAAAPHLPVGRHRHRHRPE